MSSNQIAPPRLPEAPEQYSMVYMADLLRALELFISQERNPGDIRGTTLTLSSSSVTEKTFSEYETTITIANGATTGKEAAIGIPSNFIPMGVTVSVITASTNAVNLVDIGTDTDTDGYVDGMQGAVLNSLGFKGFFPCNGIFGMSGGSVTAAAATPDEVEVVVSSDPGSATTIALKFIGISSSSDAV